MLNLIFNMVSPDNIPDGVSDLKSNDLDILFLFIILFIILIIVFILVVNLLKKNK